MDIGLAFWVVYIVAVIVYGVLNWPLSRASSSTFVFFVLIFLLGWHDFGFIIHR
jgi:hypothetical protein